MDSTQAQANGTGNDVAADVAQGTTDVANQAPLYQDSSILFHFRDMQRRQMVSVEEDDLAGLEDVSSMSKMITMKLS
ncbi:hypothetical protein OIU79_003385 [Salix purpurea]|uniref:Uncharacterized protein n=1 Tax=Salix purpurea TaxID=77065 RepID=A0A9Q0ULW7_SALPP|nr:hypothetical protein OIU79_003385 [Salix purpurea]